MRWLSGVLIPSMRIRRYLRLPRRWRRRLGMLCGEDMSDLNAIHQRILDQAKADVP